MNLKVFAVHDVKAGYFMPPFLFPTVGHAIRAMKDVAADPSSQLSRHPEDFVLYCIGVWDDQTARFDQAVAAEHLGVGTSFLPAPKERGFFDEEAR